MERAVAMVIAKAPLFEHAMISSSMWRIFLTRATMEVNAICKDQIQ